MKISELKQPYKRMAEYCRKNKHAVELSAAFTWAITNHYFWEAIDNGGRPPITEEIKKHFPPDFDFSGEEYSICYAYNENDLSNDFKISYKKIYDYTMEEFYKAKKRVEEKEKHTQLAKDGKFDQLPDTCEFSEPVELLVWDNVEPIKMNDSDLRLVSGKFRGVFIAQNSHASNKYVIWQYAKLPTPKIDFSDFKSGDVVEVELSNEEKRIGWFDFTNHNHLYIRILQRKNNNSCAGIKAIDKEKIKSITKIK